MIIATASKSVSSRKRSSSTTKTNIEKNFTRQTNSENLYIPIKEQNLEMKKDRIKQKIEKTSH